MAEQLLAPREGLGSMDLVTMAAGEERAVVLLLESVVYLSRIGHWIIILYLFIACLKFSIKFFSLSD